MNRFPPGPRDRCFGFSLLRAMRRDSLGFWHAAQRQYGDAIHLRIGPAHEFGFFHPDLIREVLVEKADAFIRYEPHMAVLRQLHGDSVLTTEGATWQRQRRELLPGFSPRRFDGYAGHMTGAAARAIAGLGAARGTPVDFEHAMNGLTMEVILATMFTDAEVDVTAVETAVRVTSQLAYDEMFDVIQLPAWLPLPRKMRLRRQLAVLDRLIQSELARRAPGTPRDDLLSMLQSLGLPEREVRDQLMTTFLAGHETTASGLTWAGWLLASHPAVAARARDEIDAVLGARTPAAADAANLPYLGQVIKEVLRLRSPAPGVFVRQAIADVTIGGWTVPRGSLVVIFSTIPQLDPRWFPEPDSFDPDRFAPERARAIPRGAWIPFGTGPRVCLGSNFAMLEMTLVLAMLLQRFELTPAPGQDAPGLAMQVTLRPAGGVRLCLPPRPAVASAAAAAAFSGCPFHAAR